MDGKRIRFLSPADYLETNTTTLYRFPHLEPVGECNQHYQNIDTIRERERRCITLVRLLCSGREMALLHRQGTEDHRGHGLEVRQWAPGGKIPAGFLIEAIPSTGYTRVESQSFPERIKWGFSGWSEA